MRRTALVLLLVACAGMPGCMNGWLYKDYKLPIVSNMRNTPRGTRMVELDSMHVEIPYTHGAVNAEMWSRAIGDAAKQNGLHEVYFADLHTIAWFGSLYRRETIEVWGD